MQLKVDVYNCDDCNRAIVVEDGEDVGICPYEGCGSIYFEYSHSGMVENV